MGIDTDDRGHEEARGSRKPRGGMGRRLLWLAWPMAGILLALALAYATLSNRHGVRTDRGWIDSRRATLPLPRKPVVADNGFYTYMAAVRSMESVGNSLPVPAGKEYSWPPALGDHEVSRRTWEAILEHADLGPGDMHCIAQLVRANSRALELLHEAADKTYVSPSEPDANAYVDHCGQLRRLAQLGMARVRLAAHEGRYADALAASRDVLALGANMPQCGGLMEAAFGDIAIAVIHRHAMEVIQNSRLSTAEYLAHARYVRGLRERLYPLSQSAALDLHVIKAIADDVDRRGEAALARLRGQPSDAKQAAHDRIRLALWRPCQSLEWIEDRMARLAEAAELPFSDGTFDAIARRIDADIKARNDWFSELLSGMLLRNRDYGARPRCSLAIEEVAALLAAYRNDHGHFPESLEALVPEYAESVPEDPFSAAPLHYERTDGAYRLWSPARDRFDAEQTAEYREAMAALRAPAPPKPPKPAGPPKPAKPARRPWPLSRPRN